jgi:hypothetical protein
MGCRRLSRESDPSKATIRSESGQNPLPYDLSGARILKGEEKVLYV